jgi:flagellar hook-associated protein 1 FlgK
MSFFALNLTGSALNAFQVAENVTSDNIANEDTTGASRQQANIEQAAPISQPGYPAYSSPGTSGDGVVVNSITRIHQDSYDQLFRGASSSQNYYTIEQQVLTSVQESFGEPSNGINTAYSNFQTAVSSLASDPTAEADQSGVLTAAQDLTEKLNSVGTAVSDAETSVIQQATSTVDTVNGLIDQIASLNGQIRAATAVGANPNTFEDERDNDIDQLSQYVSTSTALQPNGSTLVTIGGIAVVSDTQVYHLADPVVTTGSNGQPQLVIGMQGDPDPTDPTPVQVGSGQLGAYLNVYNDNLSSYGTQLDNFAAALANTVNGVTEASYDTTGAPGQALFVPAVAGEPVTASNISLGITDPSQVTTALASTAAGSEVVSANAANETVDTSQSILAGATPGTGNTQLAYPALNTGINGTLTVQIGGVVVSPAFNYATNGANANSTTIDQFISSFNAAGMGVTASWDSTSQNIVFARDPNNESPTVIAQLAANGSQATPSFIITDSNAGVSPTANGQGTPTDSILQVLGAQAINGQQQDASNAVGSSDSAGVNALTTAFATAVGVPPLQTTGTGAIASAGAVTVAAPSNDPTAFAHVSVGQLITLNAGQSDAETVQVTAVTQTPSGPTISFVATKAHAAGYTISTAATQTLGAYYSTLVTQLGNDTATATTGTTTQTSLATSINAQRQSVDGINVDEETQNLLQYQNAYEAAAKTMSVVETLLQTAIGLISTTS